MKETVKSLKTYLILFGLYTLFRIGVVFPSLPKDVTVLFLVFPLLIASGYIYFGIFLQDILVKSPKKLSTFIYITIGIQVLKFVLKLSDFFSLMVEIAISLYLLNSAKRLSTEETNRGATEPPKSPPEL
jgi:predicted membrane channel-forming protein YqfA (hemolysin III family)